jgi:hypothetical protein
MLQYFNKGEIMIKKILSLLFLLIIVAGGVFYIKNFKDDYDSSKYKASSDSKGVGSHIDFILPDQFGKSHKLSDDTKTIIFTFAKATSHIVRDFLHTQSDDFLSTKNANYIADISPMPVVIRNAFAMPDLKESNYPVLLMYDPVIASKFRDEAHKDEIMILSLEDKTIKDIKFVNDASSLSEALK